MRAFKKKSREETDTHQSKQKPPTDQLTIGSGPTGKKERTNVSTSQQLERENGTVIPKMHYMNVYWLHAFRIFSFTYFSRKIKNKIFSINFDELSETSKLAIS